jgi:hypothetical protein
MHLARYRETAIPDCLPPADGSVSARRPDTPRKAVLAESVVAVVPHAETYRRNAGLPASAGPGRPALMSQAKPPTSFRRTS